MMFRKVLLLAGCLLSLSAFAQDGKMTPYDAPAEPKAFAP